MEFDFSPTVESIESVPQDFRGLYAEQDGKHVLRTDDDAVKAAVSAITGLNRSLKAARGEVKTLKTNKVDLSPLSEYGDSPDTILERFNETLADATKGNKTKEEFARQIEKVKGDLGSEYASKIEAANQRAEALQGQLHSILVTGEAKSALADAGAIDAELALPFLERQVKVAEEDGKFQVLVVDSAGDPRYSGVTGAPMSLKELVAEMKGQDKFGPLFKSGAGQGGGTPADGARRAPQRQVAEGDMTPKQKIAAGIEARKRNR